MATDRVTACFAGSRLEALKAVQRYAEVVSILTPPNSWVHNHCRSTGTPAILVDRKSKLESFDLLSKQSVSLVVSAGFPFILPRRVLDSGPTFVNSHPSLLPSYRGFNAIKEAFARKEEYMGVTVHFMTEEVDAGPPIHQEKVPVKGLSLQEIYDLLFGIVEPRALSKSLELLLGPKSAVADVQSS